MALPTSFPNLNRKFSTERQLPSALNQLGRLALSSSPRADMLMEAVSLLSQTLGVDYVRLWELDASCRHVSLRAELGWQADFADTSWKSLEPNSMERFILASRGPVFVQDPRHETRFAMPGALSAHPAVSGVGLPVGLPEKPVGILEVFSGQPQLFPEEDVNFLQAAANILALAIERKRVEGHRTAEIQELKRQLITAQAATQLAKNEWDRFEIKNRLIESRERERLRLAQDLHDGPIQDMYGVIYQLDDLKDVLRDKDGDAEQMVNEFMDTLNKTVHNLRVVCRELRPPSLSAFGLEVAIRDHIEKFHDQNPDIHIRLELMSDVQVLSDSLRLSLFRIYQQAINNVARHAEASEVRIHFGWDERMIVLEVEDNGKGFEVPNSWVELVRQDHLGLVGLAERVESIRGKLEIVSAPGSGTLVRAIVPRN